MKDLIHNQDLEILNGDFVVAESGSQDVGLIVCSHKGEFKQFPDLGFGINAYLVSPLDPAQFQKDLSRELKKDGFGRVKITMTDDIEIDAVRLKN